MISNQPLILKVVKFCRLLIIVFACFDIYSHCQLNQCRCSAHPGYRNMILSPATDRKIRRHYLGMLKSRQNSFARVIDLYPNLAKDIFESAFNDVVMSLDDKGHPTSTAEEISCAYKEHFAMESSIRGFRLRFRFYHRCRMYYTERNSILNL